MAYSIQRRVKGDFDTVVDQVTEALQEEGFGLLCDIDVEGKFVEKLELEEFRQYRILGACNPPLARDGLEEELDLGVLLPCNVVVYEADDGTIVVSAVDPNTLLSIVEEPALDSIADDVRDRFERVLDTLPETSETTA